MERGTGLAGTGTWGNAALQVGVGGAVGTSGFVPLGHSAADARLLTAQTRAPYKLPHHAALPNMLHCANHTINFPLKEQPSAKQ